MCKKILWFWGLVISYFDCFSQTDKPNIIFILADDMGSADLGFLGSEINTPNIDNLRSEGMFLSRSYVQPQSTPSRAALLSGCYPYRFGLHEHIIIDSSNNGLPRDVKTIAEKLKECGYFTAMVGKWHLGGRKLSGLPHNRGFDKTFIGIEGAMDYWNYSNSNKYDIVEDGKKYYPLNNSNGEMSGNTYVTDLFASKASEIITNRDKAKPLFLYLSFTSPHHPLQAPTKIRDKYVNMTIDEYWSGKDAQLGRSKEGRITYMAMVDAMDKAIGSVLKTIDNEGISENTLIVFCSDNGGIIEADNRPYRGYKGDSFEGGIISSTIVKYPPLIKPMSSSDELMYIADWYPTFVNLAGGTCIDEDIDGINAIKILQGKKGNRKGVPIISCANHAYITKNYSLVGFGGDYNEIIENNLNKFQLYDLRNDKGQLYPLSDVKISNELKQLFKPHFNKVRRGFFNWDIRYSDFKGRKAINRGDHGLDYCLNDIPEMTVTEDSIVLSPVINGFCYILKGYNNKGELKYNKRYFCGKDNDSYSFSIKNYKGLTYRIEVDFHNGLPSYDSFDKDIYDYGKIFPFSGMAMGYDLGIKIPGYLSIVDVISAEGISIVSEDLVNNKKNSGCLCLTKKSNKQLSTSLTKYLEMPVSTGKLFVSFIAKLNTIETECQGEINFLQLNDTKTKVASSIEFTANKGIWNKKKISDYKRGEVVKVLCEFDFKNVGNDILKIYINPKNKIMTPNLVIEDELDFDRIQIQVTGRESARFYIDDIRVTRDLDNAI